MSNHVPPAPETWVLCPGCGERWQPYMDYDESVGWFIDDDAHTCPVCGDWAEEEER